MIAPAMAHPQRNNGERGLAALSGQEDASLSNLILSSQVPAPLRCCCGRAECIFLQHNCSVLEGVENDVKIAARLGQSLLERHEAYMADAERDRAQLVSRIGKLEMDKQVLETNNAHTIEENRALLDQLESLNSAVADSDARVQMLETSLQASHKTIRRLEGASERAEEMERHLVALETEQAALQNNLVTSESEARSAMQRWKRAERGIADLQDQLEKMEMEIRQEKEHHAEIMERMERQRAVERELNAAAGRLKGAAAVRSFQQDGAAGSNNGVVSHFVRDLLQDNANMQLGMAELREMLITSNDEIQVLRDQLQFHQSGEPATVSGTTIAPATATASAASTLRAELGPESFVERPETPDYYESTLSSSPVSSPSMRHVTSLSQELHIHHHYHVSKKKAEPVRTRKRRQGIAPNLFAPPAGTPTTQLSCTTGMSSRSSSVSSPFRAHRNRDSVSTAFSSRSNRWSAFSDQPSDFTSSSVPSSPPTNPRNSVFDRTGISDFSVPTSPSTSIDPVSPLWNKSNYQHMLAMDDSFDCSSSSPPSRLLVSPDLPSQPRFSALAEEDNTRPGLYEPILEEEVEAGDVLEVVEVEENAEAMEDMKDMEATEALEAVAPRDVDTPAISNDVPSVLHQVSMGHSVPLETTSSTPTQETYSARQDEERGSGGLDAFPLRTPFAGRRTLHRSVSHESIVSLKGGLDIHTLKVRPSQLTLRPLGTYGAAMADTGVSSVTARPVMTRGNAEMSKSNASMLRDSLSVSQTGPKGRRMSNTGSASNSNPMSIAGASATLASSRGFSRLVAWRPWSGGGNGSSGSNDSSEAGKDKDSEDSKDSQDKGGNDRHGQALDSSPITASGAMEEPIKTKVAGSETDGQSVISSSSNCDIVSVVCSIASSSTGISTNPNTSTDDNGGNSTARKEITTRGSHKSGQRSSQKSGQNSYTRTLQDMLRAPGINQPGPIPGFFQRRATPSVVQTDSIDHDALREGLEEQEG